MSEGPTPYGKPEIAEDRLQPGDWRVETVHHGSDGEVSVVIFSGPYAQREAEDYHRALKPRVNGSAPVIRLVPPNSEPSLRKLVAAERERQREKGYDAAHDDRLIEGELASAAACYAAGEELLDDGLWPFEGDIGDAIEGKDRPQQIVIAIALLEAEYERLQRAK